MPPTIATDLHGRRFGKLLVLKRGPAPPGSQRAFWLCQCDCGNTAIKMGKYLINGDTQSCGCEQRAYRAGGNRKYGDLALTHKREYTTWRSMKSRCRTPSASNYRFYGARGIDFRDEWLDFAKFLADMGPCPNGYTLDRIDPTGNYTLDNCRWASWDTQHNNTRHNLFVTFKGARMTLARASRAAEVPYHTLHQRMTTYGESFPDAVAHIKQLRRDPKSGRRLRGLETYHRRVKPARSI